MAYWVYKCNARRAVHQNGDGDWNNVFDKSQARRWGSTEWTPRLNRAHVGDTIIAHQTDRQELVGVATVTEWRKRGNYLDLILQPQENLGIDMRALKKQDARIAALRAYQPGPIDTLYEIAADDADYLLEQARKFVA